MSKYVIDSETMEGLGDAIRSVTGSDKRFTPDEMMAEVRDILNATTFVLVDKDGNEYPAVYIDSDALITAGANDIRKGYTAITADGVIEGTKEIPAYHTTEGHKFIPIGSEFEINGFDHYNYTKLLAMICELNGSVSNSVSVEKVVINDILYNANSIEKISDVIIDESSKSIKFGIINNSDTAKVVRYMTYREVI